MNASAATYGPTLGLIQEKESDALLITNLKQFQAWWLKSTVGQKEGALTLMNYFKDPFDRRSIKDCIIDSVYPYRNPKLTLSLFYPFLSLFIPFYPSFYPSFYPFLSLFFPLFIPLFIPLFPPFYPYFYPSFFLFLAHVIHLFMCIVLLL